MPNIMTFKGIHPAKQYENVVPLSHGIGGDAEKSTAEINSNPYSLLKITNPEYHIPDGNSLSEYEIQKISQEMFCEYLDTGILVQDNAESLYIYRLTSGGHCQTGIVGRVSMDDYIERRIKPHELTRIEKAIFQMHLLERVGGYMEPVFLSYDSSDNKLDLLNEIADSRDPDLSFTDNRDARHDIWIVQDSNSIESIREFFSAGGDFYICDGHHRIAAALEHAKAHPEEKDPHVAVVVFPSDETNILDYNRAVSDLNGLSENDFIEALRKNDFIVEMLGPTPARPENHGEFTMVMDYAWYLLKYTGERNQDSPVERLDVSVLQEKVIKDILGIENPQSDERLTFISGTKGLEGLEESIKKNMKVAFALRPTSMAEIISVADAGLIMPPKSTCFEPKPVMGILFDKF